MSDMTAASVKASHEKASSASWRAVRMVAHDAARGRAPLPLYRLRARLAAGHHCPARTDPLAGHHQSELIEAAEHGQIRAGESSVKHVNVVQEESRRNIGRP